MDGRIFRVIKFKTMTDERDSEGRLLPEYLPYYTDRERLRHSVRPGMTGYTQVNGRNSLSWDERLEMDVWYVEHLSFVTDLKIFFKTIVNIIDRKDVQVITGDQITSKLSQQRKPLR